MTKKMTIEGMMCGHCEARVKKTLEAIEGVEEVANVGYVKILDDDKKSTYYYERGKQLWLRSI